MPLAILTLLQGLGRLIRHRRDRGVLAILDPRIRTSAYGAPVPRVAAAGAGDAADLDDIDRFFAAAVARR